MAKRKPAGRPRKAGAYQPKGAVPFPTLGDGTAYRPGMAVRHADPTGRAWQGTVQWVTWREDDRRWDATVNWASRDAEPHTCPRATLPLADLEDAAA